MHLRLIFIILEKYIANWKVLCIGSSLRQQKLETCFYIAVTSSCALSPCACMVQMLPSAKWCICMSLSALVPLSRGQLLTGSRINGK